MRYLALATDYDGTLAQDGHVDDATVDALRRLRDSGRRLILVSGREMQDLLTVFDRLDMFDLAVLENGAVLFNPRDASTELLAQAPPDVFTKTLIERGVQPLSIGQVIVATWEPQEKMVLDVIRDLGLEMQVIFNKGSVMVLPSGVNKATGLCRALEKLGISAEQAVGIGDAENDHAFLAVCGFAAAVANALPMLKERADLVTTGARGAGVAELINMLLANDLADVAAAGSRT